MNPIRFVIIGSGGTDAKHALAIAAVPNAKLVAIWGQIPEQAAPFAREHHVEFAGNRNPCIAQRH